MTLLLLIGNENIEFLYMTLIDRTYEIKRILHKSNTFYHFNWVVEDVVYASSYVVSTVYDML